MCFRDVEIECCWTLSFEYLSIANIPVFIETQCRHDRAIRWLENSMISAGRFDTMSQCFRQTYCQYLQQSTEERICFTYPRG